MAEALVAFGRAPSSLIEPHPEVQILLHHTEIVNEDLGQFLKAISENPSIIPPERNINQVCSVEPLPITISQAVPIALIAVEAITNSLKHAFPEEVPGGLGSHLAAKATRPFCRSRTMVGGCHPSASGNAARAFASSRL